jgi:hypothetical protein
MIWFLNRWPMIFGLVGLFIVSVKIFGMIPANDDIAQGYAFVFMITIWWSYFLIASMIAWLAAYWLELKSIWLLAFAPILVLFVSPKDNHMSVWEWSYSFVLFTVVAALPILLGASSQISSRKLFHRSLAIKAS